MIWFKIFAEKHVSKLLLCELVHVSSLIPPPPAMPQSVCHYSILQ